MESSPVQLLVSPWWRGKERPQLHQIPAMREALAIAALDELRHKAAAGRGYDPFSDVRLLWAAQYLNQLENPFTIINPNLSAAAAFLLDVPLAPCGKDLAAGAA